MNTVLITGANRGIGLEHVRRYAVCGARVYAAVREPAKAQELKALATANDRRVMVVPYDAADNESPSRLKTALGDTPLDLLLVNAGVAGDKDGALGMVNADDVLHVFTINTLAPLMLAQALADNVAASQRKVIAFQSSHMGSITDNTSGGYYAYRTAKAALNMIARNAAIDLKPRRVIVVALHPGWVRTRMGGESAPVSTSECVAGEQRVLEDIKLAQTGRFFSYDGHELPW
jgi:NAD(P)-dependent dehydrogenase (short-subunit alcohol dehydrogenase family)